MGASYAKFDAAGVKFFKEKGDYAVAGLFGTLLVYWQYKKRIAPRFAKKELPPPEDDVIVSKNHNKSHH